MSGAGLGCLRRWCLGLGYFGLGSLGLSPCLGGFTRGGRLFHRLKWQQGVSALGAPLLVKSAATVKRICSVPGFPPEAFVGCYLYVSCSSI